MAAMFKETELWFKSLRKQDQPTSKQKRKCWSLSRSLPELACDPSDVARTRQSSQESRLRRRTVQVQRHLEALVEQSRRQTALLLRRQQRATAVQRFLRQPIAAPQFTCENTEQGDTCCPLTGPCGCRATSDPSAERLAWRQSDPDLCRERTYPGLPCRVPCCEPFYTQQAAAENHRYPWRGAHTI
ncbi:uncharacterized protein LOC122388887 [Amphibalanus amphitrite]|uniref:uncharacterized protein LOC122388887 n=1 Tax=Amphibalanus amphitrite TaxID=1232801 RepID=UPI001C9132DC|nr:uncharacterized protein LOC122388887 [Amphibalanus amphitrite]